MNYLLDTHIIIWFISNDPKLPSKVKATIENNENKCFVSIAFFWEIGIKYSLGRLELNSSLENIFNLITSGGFEILPITQNHILTSSKLEFHHNDPFDRVLIGQAFSEGLTLVSKDREFKKYRVSLFF